MKPNSAVKKWKLPAVPYSLLKRRQKRLLEKKKTLKQFTKKLLHNSELREEAFKRAEKYALQYKRVEQRKIRAAKKAKEEGAILVPAEPKLAFVVRIRGINQLHPKVRKVLKLFRLLQINNGVFVKLNKATLQMLRIAEPTIAWGYPNLKTVKALIYKRGYARVKRQRLPITSNKLVERKLGRLGVICMEDIIHEIYNVGPNFKKVTNFLDVFKLNNPNRGFRKKTNHFVEGGDFGNRENLINKLLRRMI